MNVKILHTAVTIDIAQIYEYINRVFLITTDSPWRGAEVLSAAVPPSYVHIRIIVTDVPTPTYLGTSANIPFKSATYGIELCLKKKTKIVFLKHKLVMIIPPPVDSIIIIIIISFQKTFEPRLILF